MAIKYKIDQHHVCFPTKVLSDKVGRVLNMVIKEDTDNGTVCGKGKYVSFDQYEVADAPAGFEGEILEQAADGNWYVEVKKVDPSAPAILFMKFLKLQKPIIVNLPKLLTSSTQQQPKEQKQLEDLCLQ